jgi:hypothetical protein
LAVFGSLDQLGSQALDDGVIQPFRLRGSAHVAHVVGEHLGQEVHSGNDFFCIETGFASEFLPFTRTYLAKLLFPTDLHRELHLLQVNIVVGKDAGDIVEWRKSYGGAAGQE